MQNQIFTKRKLKQAIVQYTIIAVLILAVGGYFGVKYFLEYRETTKALESESQELIELKAAADNARNNYSLVKKESEVNASANSAAIDKVMPSSEDFTELARDLDEYFINTRKSANPMFLSDLRFSSPVVKTDNDYAVLPFSMNVSGDELGLAKFIKYVEESGDINSGVRLMEVKSISLNYQDTGKGDLDSGYVSPVREVTASMNLNAFFQKPLEDN